MSLMISRLLVACWICVSINGIPAQERMAPPPVARSEVSLSQRLKSKISLNLSGARRSGALARIGTQIGVRFDYIGDDEDRKRDPISSDVLEFTNEPAEAVIGAVLARSGMSLVVDDPQDWALIVKSEVAKELGWPTVVFPELSIQSRLNEQVMVDFRAIRLSGALRFLLKQADVPYQIIEEDLTRVGVSGNTIVTLTAKNASAADALHQILHPLKLCVVLDPSRGTLKVTSRKAANLRGWKLLVLKEPHPNTLY